MELKPLKKIRSISYGLSNLNPYVVLVNSPQQDGKICSIEPSDDDFFEKYRFIRYSVYVLKGKEKWLWHDFDLPPERITYFFPDGTEEYLLG